MALFNALDRNHDGVITRSEFNAAVSGAPATATTGAVSYVSPAPAVSYASPAAVVQPAPAVSYASPAPAAPPSVAYAPAAATAKPVTANFTAPTVSYASPAPTLTPAPAPATTTYTTPAPAVPKAPAPAPGVQYIVNDPIPMPVPAPAPAVSAIKPAAAGSYVPTSAAPTSYGTPVAYSTQPTAEVKTPAVSYVQPQPAGGVTTYASPAPVATAIPQQPVSYVPQQMAPISYVPTTMPTGTVMGGTEQMIYGANAVPVGAEAVVKAQVGQWLICEDGLGEFYSDALTGQSYDDPPADLLIKAGELRFLQLVQLPAAPLGAPLVDANGMYYEAPMAAPVVYSAPQPVSYALSSAAPMPASYMPMMAEGGAPMPCVGQERPLDPTRVVRQS